MNRIGQTAQTDPRLYHAWRTAGILADVMRRHYGGDYEVEWDESEYDPRSFSDIRKSAAAIKLAVDRMCDNLAGAYLTALYPDYGFVGEESFDAGQMEKPLFWCVDPICGSMGYFKQTGYFGTSIALVDREQGPILGVLNCPGLDTSGIAFPEMGLLEFGGDYPESAVGKLKAVMSGNMKDHEAVVRVLDLIGPDVLDYQQSIPTKAMGVLLGQYDFSFGLPRKAVGGGVKLWDMAASESFFKAAGMPLVDFDGNPIHVTGASDLRFANGYIMARDETVAARVIDAYRRAFG